MIRFGQKLTTSISSWFRPGFTMSLISAQTVAPDDAARLAIDADFGEFTDVAEIKPCSAGFIG